MPETSEPVNGVGQPCRDWGRRQVRKGHLEALVGGDGSAALWHLLRMSSKVPLDGRGLHGFGRGEDILKCKTLAACNW